MLGLWPAGVFFLIVIVGVPLTALLPSMDGVTRGLFVGQGHWDLVFTSFTLLGASLSWLFVYALNVEGELFRRFGRPPRGTFVWREYLPRWAERHFSVPFTWHQFASALVLALPGTVVIFVTRDGSDALLAVGGIALGMSFAYLASLLGSVLFLLASYEEDDIGTTRATRAVGALRWAWLRAVRDWLGLWFSRETGAARAKKEVDPSAPEDAVTLQLDHFAAVTIGATLGVVLLGLLVALDPRGMGIQATSGALVFLIVTVMIWVIGALQFHLAHFLVSPVLVLLVGMVVGYGVCGADHYYEVRPVTAAAPEFERVSPRETLPTLAPGARKNLVIVSATGGGIWAAAWTTRVLEILYARRPELERELRVISAVSGGAVGTAFLIDERLADLRRERPAGEKPRSMAEVAGAARRKSSCSSLEAVSYGLAFRDVPRLLTFGGWSYLFDDDRGTLLQDRWCRNARSDFDCSDPDLVLPVACEQELSLADVARAVKAGTIPLPILNTTAMEVGRRVMTTPMTFPEGPVRSGPDRDVRAWTLDEYLYGEGTRADVSLWTAARLAATFPYISPAVRAAEDVTLTPRGAHHLVDGGYYDNYGVAGALDWFDAAVRDMQGVRFDQVVVVQIRAFPDGEMDDEPSSGAAASALIGPLSGLLAIRTGAARQRNDVDLGRFLDSVRDDMPHTRFDTVVFEPEGETTDPLNWRLTPEDLRRIDEDVWTAAGPNARELDCLVHLLETAPSQSPSSLCRSIDSESGK